MKFSPYLLLPTFFLASLAPARSGIPLNPPVPEGFGVNIHFTTPRPGEMKEIAATGVHWVRMDFSWGATERVKGVYDFSAYDGLLAALSPYHIRPIWILDYGNKLYDRGLPPHSSAARQAFAQWAAAAAHHFRGRGVVWEMYNEPNNITFWKPKPNVFEYIPLALATGEAMREADPNVTIIGPATALIDLRYIAACVQAGLLNFWSGVSVHPYRQLDPETVARGLFAVRWMIARYEPKGKHIPVIVSEWGYSSTWKYDHMDEQTQARMLAREWLTEVMNQVPIGVWYEWSDDSPDPHNSDAHFGLVRFPYRAGGDPVYEPKPAYIAARTLSHALDGYRFVRRLSIVDARDYVLLFTRGGQARLAAWTTSAPHTIVIAGASGRFRVTGFEGARLPAVRAHHRSLRLKLSPDPIYLAPQKPGGLAGTVKGGGRQR